MIAGLLPPSSGRILLDAEDITLTPPRNRDLAMVFQSYALYPHLTVAQNIGFPLRGGSVISPDRKKLTFADAPAVQAVSTLQNLVKSGASPNLTQAQAIDEFSRGNLGMLLESSALQGMVQQASTAGKWELRAAALPGFPGKAAVPTNSGSGLMVFSDDPAKERATALLS